MGGKILFVFMNHLKAMKEIQGLKAVQIKIVCLFPVTSDRVRVVLLVIYGILSLYTIQ